MLLTDENASLYVYLAALLAVGTLIVKYLNQTDIPKIKNLPELPGVPML
jgi:phenylacetate 2-hydroxylase